MDLPPAVHDPAQVRELVGKILSEPRYDRPAKSIPDRILAWFGEQIGKVLGSLVGGGPGTVVAWLVVVGVLGLVIFLVLRFGRVGRVVLPPEPMAQVMVELTRTPSEWRADAADLEAAGRWREGLRCRHRAIISDLVRRGAIPDHVGRTAGEYVRDIAKTLPEAAPALAAATELFEAAWYGNITTGRAESERFQAMEAQVLAVRTGG